MFTVTETEMFQRYAADVWSGDEREEFVDWIAANPEAGNVIPGFTPLRKVRWTSRDKGKKGGVRVIYYMRRAVGNVNLLIVYPKSKSGNLSQAFLRELRKLLE